MLGVWGVVITRIDKLGVCLGPGLWGWLRTSCWGISTPLLSFVLLGVYIVSFFFVCVFFVCIVRGRLGRFRILGWSIPAAMMVASVPRKWVFLIGV